LYSEPFSKYCVVFDVDLTNTGVAEEGRNVMRTATVWEEDLNLVCNETMPSPLLCIKNLTRLNINHGVKSVIAFLYRSRKWLDEKI